MPSLHAHTDRDRALAGAVLTHPLVLQLTSATVEVLSAIATSDGRTLSSAERRLLRHVLVVIECAEVLISRRTA